MKRLLARSPLLDGGSSQVHWQLCNAVDQVEFECGLRACIHCTILAVAPKERVARCIVQMNTEKRLNTKAKAFKAATCCGDSALILPRWLDKLLM